MRAGSSLIGQLERRRGKLAEVLPDGPVDHPKVQPSSWFSAPQGPLCSVYREVGEKIEGGLPAARFGFFYLDFNNNNKSGPDNVRLSKLKRGVFTPLWGFSRSSRSERPMNGQ